MPRVKIRVEVRPDENAGDHLVEFVDVLVDVQTRSQVRTLLLEVLKLIDLPQVPE